MGRTKRLRNQRKLRIFTPNSSLEMKNLTNWMKNLGWKNVSKLKLKNFENTGRGLTSSKSLKNGDILIEAPLNILITMNTILRNESFLKILTPGLKYRIQELLSVFLVFEKGKIDSEWKFYLESLPKTKVSLPWLNPEDFSFYPANLREKCGILLENFLESWKRVQRIFEALNFNFEDFVWGYTMVNTRAVFVDPKYFYNDLLIDEPNLALFPFMDMFNHADNAENSVEILDNPETFLLKTLKNQRKNQEIFISYGRHDNLKLFTEYGFYLSKNLNDKLLFKPEEIIKILNLNLDNFQYNFLKNHDFLNIDELFISFTGLSFKLKGFLYVALNNDVKNYNYMIYSGKFHDIFMKKLKICAGQLIQWKILEYQSDVCRFEGCERRYVLSFLENRVRFAENLKEIIDDFT